MLEARIASLLIAGGGRFPQILDLSGFENWSCQWLPIGATSTSKIIVTDDVTLWSKLKSTW